MNQTILIKSYQGGLSLHINSDETFDVVLQEIADKFEESRRFFKNASVAISVEGRLLDTDEEKRLIQTINEHSDLNVICLVGKNEETNKKFIKALKTVEIQKEEYNGRFYHGNVLEDQVVESEGSLVVIGNVLPGGTVAAGKDIIVLGELSGEAYAGLNNNNNHFVMAGRFNPAKCKIGSLQYKHKDKGLFGKKNKDNPMIAYCSDSEVIADVLSPEMLTNVASI